MNSQVHLEEKGEKPKENAGRRYGIKRERLRMEFEGMHMYSLVPGENAPHVGPTG